MSNTAPHNQPVRLQPVYIPKPWGQEIWYTGMEARGESQVQWGQTQVPISDYIGAAQQPIGDHPLLLLKVLDPSPVEVTGDLYFEVHEQKQEVYIVTHVDPAAWPDGVGQIRFGMNPDKRQAYASDAEFRAAYLAAVQAYEQVRRRIDTRTEAGADESTEDLHSSELQLRRAMEAFTRMAPLRVGDVVQVPTWTPHSLQHGVRVVEFQTPTYERYIVSFAQKVLTQNHWDSTTAIERMHLDPPADPSFETVAPGVERIARFDTFNAWRVNGAVSGPLKLPAALPYAVVMALADAQVGNLQLHAEQACLIPRAAIADTQLHSDGHLLVAAPGL